MGEIESISSTNKRNETQQVTLPRGEGRHILRRRANIAAT